MNKVIIFDFNRTLFDPSAQALMPNALDIVRAAQQKGYTLVLLAKAAPSRRELIAELGLAPFFAEIQLVNAKSARMFRDIADRYAADLSASYVIGDRAHGEILHGHTAGWRTIWLRAGAFAHELPNGYTPTHIVQNLNDILPLL